MDMLLVVVLVILAGFGLHGYLRGMVRVLFSLVAIFLTIGLATALAPYTEEFLRTKTPMYDTVKEKCTEHIHQQTQEKQEKGQTSKQQELTLFGLQLPEEFQNFFSEHVTDGADKFMEDTGVYGKLGDYAANFVLQRLAWILSFTIILILLSVIVHMLDLITKLPVLKSINRLGGLIIGLMEGVLVVWLLFLLIVLCQNSELGKEMMTSIQQQPILKFLYDYNMIEQLL